MKGIITICGSTRFKKEFQAVNAVLTLKDYSVLTVGVFGHAIKDKKLREECWDDKVILDKLHKGKIDISSAIFVVDGNERTGFYIGISTKAEISHAKKYEKSIYYLSKEMGLDPELFDDLDRDLYEKFLQE